VVHLSKCNRAELYKFGRYNFFVCLVGHQVSHGPVKLMLFGCRGHFLYNLGGTRRYYISEIILSFSLSFIQVCRKYSKVRNPFSLMIPI
jgi:hypothetical protein